MGWMHRSTLCTCIGLFKIRASLLMAATSKQPNGQERGRTKRNLVVKEHRRSIILLVLPPEVHINAISAWHLVAVKYVCYIRNTLEISNYGNTKLMTEKLEYCDRFLA